jgi:hypothetical protein
MVWSLDQWPGSMEQLRDGHEQEGFCFEQWLWMARLWGMVNDYDFKTSMRMEVNSSCQAWMGCISEQVLVCCVGRQRNSGRCVGQRVLDGLRKLQGESPSCWLVCCQGYWRPRLSWHWDMAKFRIYLQTLVRACTIPGKPPGKFPLCSP